MNSTLQFLLNTGDVKSKRTLELYDTIGPIAYTTEYKMNAVLGEFVWYLTWKHPECDDDKRLSCASIRNKMSRARRYFPGYLDCRIPPENREGLEELALKYNVHVYDKFDWIIATKGKSLIKHNLVREVEPIDCEDDYINCIEVILEEYNRTL